MKRANIILWIVLILALCFVVFFFAGGTLQAEVSSISAQAQEYPDAFTSIQNVISSGAAPYLFTNDLPDDPANYRLVDITVTLTNRGIFDAEWLDIQLEGITGDVAVYSLSGEGDDIASRSSGQINLKLITRAPEDSPRKLRLQYYVYGISRTIKINV